MTSADVVVLGAGPAGLYAAWKAAQTGRSVVVLEARDQVGGMAASITVAGQRVDLGSHRLHPATPPEILGELRGLLGDDLQTRQRHGRVRMCGRWLGFPLRAGDLLRNLPPGVAASAAFDAASAPLRHAREDTYAELVRDRLGPTILRTFYGPYARKLWDVDAASLAGDLARRRISTGSPGDLVRRMRRARTPTGRTFLSPRRGFGQISEALADAAVGAGAVIRLGDRVQGIDLGHADAAAVTAGSATVAAGVVLSTLPATSLPRLVTPRPADLIVDAAASLRSRAMVLVYLVVDRGRCTEYDAHYFPAPDTPVSRLSEPRNYRTSADDPTDRSVLCAEIPCTEGDSIWTLSTARLGELVTDSMIQQGLPLHPRDIVGVDVVRLPRVYPVYRTGFEDSLAPVLEWAASSARLASFGRQGLFVPDNTHHAMIMAAAAVDAIGPDQRIDHQRWRAALDAFSRHVVED